MGEFVLHMMNKDILFVISGLRHNMPTKKDGNGERMLIEGNSTRKRKQAKHEVEEQRERARRNESAGCTHVFVGLD